VNLWLGTSGFAVPRNIREGIIKFRVDNSWLSGEKIDPGKVTMMKWDGSQWITLEIKQVKTDGNFAYYEALTNSFSPFAIGGVKAVTTPGASPTAAPGVSPTAAPPVVSPPTALNWMLMVVVAVVAIIIIAGAYFYSRINKELKEK